jgi:hypothetical protein
VTTFIDSTLSGAESNSYVSVLEASELLLALPQSPGIAEWLEFPEEDQERTLIGATMTLDALSWAGRKCQCDQRLQWPRLVRGCRCGATKCDVIPTDIMLATSWLAASLGLEGGFMGVPSTAVSEAGVSGVDALDPFSEVTVGPLKVKMKEQTTGANDLGSIVGMIPSFVAELVKEYLNGVNMSQPRLTRRSSALAHDGYIGSPAYSGTMYLKNGKVYPRFGSWTSRR